MFNINTEDDVCCCCCSCVHIQNIRRFIYPVPLILIPFCPFFPLIFSSFFLSQLLMYSFTLLCYLILVSLLPSHDNNKEKSLPKLPETCVSNNVKKGGFCLGNDKYFGLMYGRPTNNICVKGK